MPTMTVLFRVCAVANSSSVPDQRLKPPVRAFVWGSRVGNESGPQGTRNVRLSTNTDDLRSLTE